MGDATTKETEAAPAEEKKELVGKDLIYQKVADQIELKTGKRFGRTNGQAIVNLVVEELLALAVQDDSLRLNQGFGSFHVRTYPPGERKLPSGEVTKFGERRKIRYEGGVMTDLLIEHGGNLDKARAQFQAERSSKKAEAAETTAAPAEEEENLD